MQEARAKRGGVSRQHRRLHWRVAGPVAEVPSDCAGAEDGSEQRRAILTDRPGSCVWLDWLLAVLSCRTPMRKVPRMGARSGVPSSPKNLRGSRRVLFTCGRFSFGGEERDTEGDPHDEALVARVPGGVSCSRRGG